MRGAKLRTHADIPASGTKGGINRQAYRKGTDSSGFRMICPPPVQFPRDGERHVSWFSLHGIHEQHECGPVDRAAHELQTRMGLPSDRSRELKHRNTDSARRL